ncbi:MAG: hypothetical protein K1X67_08050 [Fimbriimonadaceae bacterium]|nr:hypothetical protein [Fimbriimonadaceae bacterium]
MKPTVGRIVHVFGMAEHFYHQSEMPDACAGIVVFVDPESGLPSIKVLHPWGGTDVNLSKVELRGESPHGICWDWPAREG